MNPLMTIVTITYQNVTGLQKTIEGLQSQSSHDFEQWIIDGGSNDSTKEYLESLKVPWTLHWISEKDSGRYQAMNKGTVKATGDYIWYLNAGDIPADSQVISDLNSLVKAHPNADLIYGKIIFASTFGTQISGFEVGPKNFKYGMPVSHPGMLFRRKVVLENSYDEDFTIISDWLLVKKLFTNSQIKTHFYDRVITIFDTNGLSSTNLLQDLSEKLRSEKKPLHYFQLAVVAGTKIMILSFLKMTGLYPAFKKWKSRRSNH